MLTTSLDKFLQQLEQSICPAGMWWKKGESCRGVDSTRSPPPASDCSPGEAGGGEREEMVFRRGVHDVKTV